MSGSPTAALQERRALHEVITFYSYKGGTGRTMALANVACLLARGRSDGKRVLMVDWDLEAPGLHHYFKLSDSVLPSPRLGLVELFTRLIETASSGLTSAVQDEDRAAEALLSTIEIEEFVHPTAVSNLVVMPAGHMDDAYQSRLTKLDWQGLYARVPAIYRVFARELARKFAAVLVDSRTGLTDIGGVCTALLPDKLVVVFTPNQQSLTGIEKLVSGSVTYRQESRDLRPLLVYPLASRIDAERDTLRELWRHGDSERGIEGYQKQLERVLKQAYGLGACDLSHYCDEVLIKHSPDYSYGEQIAALESTSSDRYSFVRGYEVSIDWMAASAVPWETPALAMKRTRLEELTARETDMRGRALPDERGQLHSLQEELLGLLSDIRGEYHPDAVDAAGRLIQTLLANREGVSRAEELLQRLVGGLPKLRVPLRWRALSTVLEGAGRLRLGERAATADMLVQRVRSELDRSQTTVDKDGLAPLADVADALAEKAYLAEARALREWILQSRRQILGDGHLDTLNSMSALAKTLLDLGDLAGARALHEQVLASLRRTRGEGDLATLRAMENLAVTLGNQGDLPGARALQEQVLAGRRRMLGEQHPDTLAAMSNLAVTLRDQGHLADARELLEQASAELQRALREEHPDTLKAMINLAVTLGGQGNLTGARTLLEQVLARQRRVLGEDHPDTLAAMNSLAATLGGQGDLPGARTLLEQVLAGRRRVLGEDHPDTLSAMSNLAATLGGQGDLPGARALQEQALAAFRRVLGEEHPHTLASMNDLARVLWTQRDLAGAQTLQEQVLAGRRRVLGEEHPDTLRAMNNLAVALGDQGDLARARTLEEQALEGRRRVLGDQHPDTLWAMGNLAVTLQSQGDLVGARGLEEQALPGLRRALGNQHPDTLRLMNNLAVTVKSLGDLPGARALQEEVVDLRRQALGADHPETMASMNQLVSTLLELNEIEAAKRLQDELLAAQQRTSKGMRSTST